MHTRHTGVQKCLVLEEVEMPPAHLLGVVCRAVRRAAAGASKPAAGGEVDVDVELTRLGVELAADDRPWRYEPNASCSRLVSRMVISSALAPARLSLAPCSPPSRTLRAASRWPAAILDRSCAQRLRELRPGRRNGSQPNRETPDQPRDWLSLPTPNSEEAVYFQFHAVPHPTWTLHDGTCGMTKIAIPIYAPKPKADAVRARLHGEYQRHAYDLLVDLLATIGEKGRSGVPDNLPSAPEQAWRDALYARSMPGRQARNEAEALQGSRECDNFEKNRHADDIVVGFEHQADAERFMEDMRARLAAFALAFHSEKTRLVEFGRHAAKNRRARGLGKPETFNFLGFTHISGRSRKGDFQLKRKSRSDRVRATLAAVKETLRRRMHETIDQQGAWLRQVVMGFNAYHAVPTNFVALADFRYHVTNLWRRTLRWRGQKGSITWARMTVLQTRWLPKPRIAHPWPSVRFAVKHPRWEPYAGNPPVRICAGGAR